MKHNLQFQFFLSSKLQLQYQPPVYQQQNIQYNRPQVAKQIGSAPRRPIVQPQYESAQQSDRYNKDESEEPEYDVSSKQITQQRKYTSLSSIY